MVCVDAPSDPRGLQQVGEPSAFTRREAEVLSPRLGIHQPHNIKNREPRLEHFEHRKEIVVEACIVARFPIVYLVGDATEARLAKHSPESWCVSIEVGSHDDDVIGPKCGVVFEGAADDVVEYENLPHRARARMD